jgi:hypothetical protein
MVSMNCHCTAVTLNPGELAHWLDGWKHTPAECVNEHAILEGWLADRRAAFGSYAQRALEGGGA